MATAVSHIFMKNGNGKRENSQMDMDSDDPEFVPLSKRINNLHLHQTSGQSSHQQQQHHHHNHPHLHGHHPHGHGHDSHSLNGVIDNPGALSPNSPLSPHNSPSSGSHHHNHDGRMGHTDPNFHCNNIPSPQDIDFQMRNACINSETSNFRSGPSSHGSGMNDDISKSHNSTGLMYNQHHQNVNGLQLQRIDYNPSMDSSSNPHYYESNRELYLLYVERMNRTRQVLHPHFYEPQ